VMARLIGFLFASSAAAFSPMAGSTLHSSRPPAVVKTTMGLFSLGKQQKPLLLAIDDCLIEAADGAAADECLVPPAAQSELVEETSFTAFYPLLAVALAICISISLIPPNPDQAIGDLGTPQIVGGLSYSNPYLDSTPIPGPPPPGF